MRGFLRFASTVAIGLALSACGDDGGPSDGGVLPKREASVDIRRDAGVEGGRDAEGGSDAQSMPDSGITPEEFADLAQDAIEASMATNVLAALLTELGSDPVTGPLLSFAPVPQGQVESVAVGVAETADSECQGQGSDYLNRCPAVIECPSAVFVRYGDGCLAPSGKPLSGGIIIRSPSDGSGTVTWILERLSVGTSEAEGGFVSYTGAIQMTPDPNGGLLFNAAGDGLFARIPRGDSRRLRDRDRPLRIRLSDISMTQDNTGTFSVLGPDTFEIEVPITCGTNTASITYTVEDCGGWDWPTPLGSCLCPESGELRLFGPILDPCNNPQSEQALSIEFDPQAPMAACGSNLKATGYFAASQCAGGCAAACDPQCINTPFGQFCASVDLSDLIQQAAGWVCDLPSTICQSIFDGGTCPSGGGDGGATALDGGNQELDSGQPDSDGGQPDGGAVALDAQPPQDAGASPADGGLVGLSGTVFNASTQARVWLATITLSNGATGQATTNLFGNYSMAAPSSSQFLIHADHGSFRGHIIEFETTEVETGQNFSLLGGDVLGGIYGPLGLTYDPNKGTVQVIFTTSSTAGGEGATLNLAHDAAHVIDSTGALVPGNTVPAGSQSTAVAFPNVAPGLVMPTIISPPGLTCAPTYGFGAWPVLANVLTDIQVTCQ